MNTKKVKNKHGFLWSVFNQKCPRCRSGDMFQDKSSYKLKSFMKMNEYCPICGQSMEIEKGFYYGTGYVSYVITVAFSVSTFAAWWLLIGFSLEDNRIFWWIGVNSVLMILLQPWFMRLSRAVWLSFFVSYNPASKAEKTE
ncbi:MAG: DUF983 domain-containing protein [Chitinophagaceae bacterium]|nr:MAG: DUF983 domain-containing protein [Chitinophagaceae bacterium]